VCKIQWFLDFFSKVDIQKQKIEPLIIFDMIFQILISFVHLNSFPYNFFPQQYYIAKYK
jgi:hypothetical protein